MEQLETPPEKNDISGGVAFGKVETYDRRVHASFDSKYGIVELKWFTKPPKVDILRKKKGVLIC